MTITVDEIVGDGIWTIQVDVGDKPVRKVNKITLVQTLDYQQIFDLMEDYKQDVKKRQILIARLTGTITDKQEIRF